MGCAISKLMSQSSLQVMPVDPESDASQTLSYSYLPEVFRNSYASLNAPQKQAVDSIEGAL